MAGEGIGVARIMRRIMHGLDMREADETDDKQSERYSGQGLKEFRSR